MPKAEPPPKSMMGSPSAASGDPVFTAQVQWEGTTLLVGVFGGSSVAVQHVEKLLHNDFQLGRRRLRAIYVRRWELDRPNPDPETNGEEELVWSKVVPTYHVGDLCPCEYCRNSIPRGGNGGIPPREYAGLPVPHPQPGPEPEPIPEPRSCQWCRCILPETSTEHFCSDACREEALEACPSDSDESDGRTSERRSAEDDVRERIHEDRSLCTMCGSPQGPNGCSYCDGPINPGDTDDETDSRSERRSDPPMYAPEPELVAAGVSSNPLDLFDCE